MRRASTWRGRRLRASGRRPRSPSSIAGTPSCTSRTGASTPPSSNMTQGFCMFDSEQRLLVCNDRYAEMYGLTRSR